MAARLERSDLPAIARNLGKAGRPMPQWVGNDPALISEYDQGTGAARNRAAPHLPPDSAAPPRPSPSAPRTPRAGRSGFGSAAQRTQSASDRVVRRQISAAGDGGGLLLAFVLYPIALSILKFGAAGPAVWFRAKWLNETAKDPNNLGPITGTAPGAPGNASGPPPSGPKVTLPRPPGWKGSWPPPGSQPPASGPSA